MKSIILLIALAFVTTTCIGEEHKPQTKAEINKLLNKMTQQNQGMLRRAGHPVKPIVPLYSNTVGYRPVITWLPEGTQMGAFAVISADRRYVRISCYPFFSSIGRVYTFSYSR